ncbi:hypothetical protein [Streptomyces sp. ML-6]|uniref:hypothetical protein n=1 Tax=Streptomyces sp. ML-6 TaxID=2982693 RepID=UPI0024C05745|nr:hypothetical protein [Streptomyces sp. ML-6]MDK0524989.1 hypothetical protein [Streptomyces sp. ML-6]
MATTLITHPFATPDIRPSGTDGIETAEARNPDLDMEEIRDELYAALQHIENLRHQHPYEATGYGGWPPQTTQPEIVEGECKR